MGIARLLISDVLLQNAWQGNEKYTNIYIHKDARGRAGTQEALTGGILKVELMSHDEVKLGAMSHIHQRDVLGSRLSHVPCSSLAH